MSDRPTTLAARVCRTLEGITMLNMSEDPFESLVYRFTHVAAECCCNPHEDWVKEFEAKEIEIERACRSPNKRKQDDEDAQRIREQQ